MRYSGYANLDFWMIRCYPEAYQAEWYRQLLIHVNDDIFDQSQQPPSGIEARWTRSNDCYPERRGSRVHNIAAESSQGS
jgi:hypothetical protein